MKAWLEAIHNCGEEEINDVINALISRHAELYPDWELVIFSLDKTQDRNNQIDRAAALMKKLE